MVSRKGRDAVVQHALLPSDSPLEKTPHKTGNGELSITCSNKQFGNYSVRWLDLTALASHSGGDARPIAFR